MLKELKEKPDNMTLTRFFEDFAGRRNMKPGQVQAMYYNNVRTDYEKWKAGKSFNNKPKPPTGGSSVQQPPKEKISQYDIAKAVKTYEEEGPVEIPMQVGRIVDPSILKMRIAFLESRMKTLKDPYQRLIVEPWLEELKGGQ